jgi:DNA repair protein REV1
MGTPLEKKSTLVRKRIENHNFDDEQGEEYEGSAFGGFADYFRRKKIKLQNLDHELRAQSDKPQIFKGIVCHVNGYTQPSLNDLHVMIVQHGGGFLQYLDGKTMVTHIIASNLTPKKKEEFKRYRIVKPAWIVDSVKAGKLLPWDAYRVVDEGVGQKVLGFENGSIVSQANRKAQGYKEQTDASWYTSQFKSTETPQGKERFTQTVTPVEEVEEDEFSLPEITSSMEMALEAVEQENAVQSIENEPAAPRNLLEVRTELETPPLSSPVEEPPEIAVDRTGDPHLETASHEQLDPAKRRAREWSQEADYSMAVVRDSEVFNNISPERLAKMTAEEHNALLLSDPRIRKSTVVNPDFLDQYYRESRLHHLSTWKAELKSQLQALAAEKSSSQKAKFKKLPGQRRYIMHVDFDSFFAAVSLKKYPQFKDRPCVVAHGSGSGSEIASCNYPARHFGIKNGMWMKKAQELCPELKILPYDFAGYEDASRKFYDAILGTGGLVQSVSIDEALIDISAIALVDAGTDGVCRGEGAVDREEAKADEIAQHLRDQVLEKTGCNVSVGIGGNILLAKAALRKAKPAGQYQLKPEDVLEFIGGLEVQNLPGVAWSIGGKLEEIGIKFVRDIRECTKEKLVQTLGPKTGEKIWEYARGIDKTAVGDQVVRKSISAEVNWGVRFENQEQVDEFMYGLCGELHRRLVKERVKGKQLTMKVMRRAQDAPLDPPKHLGHGKCDTYNKSSQLGVATSETSVIAKEAIAMLKSFGISPGELRGIGVQMQKLEPIKAGGTAEGSQRRLPFKIGPAGGNLGAQKKTDGVEDPIKDDVKTPQKPKVAKLDEPSIPVDVVNSSTPTKKQLNTLGTQFVLPTQVDPSVLAELPGDIISKLSKRVKPRTESIEPEEMPGRTSEATSRSNSPATQIALPTHSQLDPSILEALPEDVRAEVLGFYRTNSAAQSKPKAGQALLPQSPRKSRTLAPPKAGPSKAPTKRKRGGSSLHGKLRAPKDESTTLTQANFVSRPETAAGPAEPQQELDPEFLAALPDDIRAEVLAQHRTAELQRKGGIDLSLHARKQKKKARESAAKGQPRRFTLPPRVARPTFTSRKLSTLPELREAMGAWYREFSDEGPYEEDTEALVSYLRRVVGEERDVQKAVGVVRWLTWLHSEGEGVLESGVRERWDSALENLKGGVQDAVKERGMSDVDFG